MSMDLIDAHLNVGWLRPESALCDAIASERLSHYPLPSPSLDMGCGNGIFSFITAGGRLNQDVDYYDDDLRYYEFIVDKEPSYRIDHGCDLTNSLPYGLRFYSGFTYANANKPWPYPDGAFASVFSNMLYWLNSPEHAFSELSRVLRPGGKALLTVQARRIDSYRLGWKSIECGRDQHYKWRLGRGQLRTHAASHGFRVLDQRSYLSPVIIKVWDIGTRPIIKPLRHMLSYLDDDGYPRIKAEWIAAVKPIVEELYAMEPERPSEGGHHLIYLEKK